MSAEPQIRMDRPRLRTHFFAGLVVLAPLFFTLVIVSYLVKMADAFIVNPVFRLLPLGEGTAVRILLAKAAIAGVVILFIIFVGLLAEFFIFKKFISLFENALKGIPFFSKVYSSIKEIADAFFGDKKGVFKRVVFLEYPRKGIYTLGFVTQEKRWEIHDKTGREWLSVFIPHPPNPAGGVFIFAAADEVIASDMTVEDGIKLVISGGSALPPPKPKA